MPGIYGTSTGHPTCKVHFACPFPGFLLLSRCPDLLLITDLLIISWSPSIGEGHSGCKRLFLDALIVPEGWLGYPTICQCDNLAMSQF
jgi:hypothetical protein